MFEAAGAAGAVLNQDALLSDLALASATISAPLISAKDVVSARSSLSYNSDALEKESLSNSCGSSSLYTKKMPLCGMP